MSSAAVSRTRSTDKRFYGVVEGVVTDVNDTKAKEGRVKVQFPWFDEKMETEWCRVHQFYAGNGYGAFFVPEVGDEVLVAFIQGDMRLPIILGGLYNGKDKPPSHRAPDLDQKLIRTKGGHELLFDDTQGKQRVRIRTNGGHTVDLDDSTRTITLQTGAATITIYGASGNIRLRGGGRSLEMRDAKVEIS